jgi:hypothetical protein
MGRPTVATRSHSTQQTARRPSQRRDSTHEAAQSRDRKYWALVSVPAVYNIEAGLSETDEHLWTVKGSDVRRGDRVALWRGLKDKHRGIVALAEVLSDPENLASPPEYRKFWNVEPSPRPERRVRIRFVRPPKMPLWLDSPGGSVLKELTVARGQGTVFHITQDQWQRLLRVLGGWHDAKATEETVTAMSYDRARRAYDQVVERKVRAEQGWLRKFLFRGADQGTCTLCGQRFPIELLVAAHIKQRSQCTPREREDYRANIVAMCKLGCDALFERGYISAIKGQWTANEKKTDTTTEALQAYIDAVVGKDCAH